MEKYFNKENGQKVNLLEHCRDIVNLYPDVQILIATDSQNTSKNSRYATAIVFRYARGQGAHYIYNITTVNKIRDTFTRLFKECELSIEIAEFITKNTIYKISAIELDYNDFKKTASTPLVSATKGWVESLGYNAILKSGEMIASKAADKCCRN